ncbi:RNA polymerase III-inhibiting protein maf1 [Sarracenia purpurea var. burkii]
MADNAEDTNVTAEEQLEPKTPTMADAEEQPPQHQAKLPQEAKKPEKMSNISFSIWPPTQRTRDAVINRLIETLSAPSVLSQRYGSLPHDDATEAARRIEDEAFATAATSASDSADDDGIEILQIYSKEISKRMLDTAKSRSAKVSTQDGNNAPQPPAVEPAPTAEEIESES